MKRKILILVCVLSILAPAIAEAGPIRKVLGRVKSVVQRAGGAVLGGCR